MGYMHIDNLYKNQTVLMYRECYALEKIHGTSAHVAWNAGKLSFFSGGEKHNRFLELFDNEALTAAFTELGHDSVVVYGEAYGGSQQKQAWRYGVDLRFVAFDVKVGDTWLTVPNAESVCNALGLEFVHYTKVSTDLAAIDAERDAPSEQARRNGVLGDQPREGVVLRPLCELTTSNGSRVMAKHKRDEERETATARKVVDPTKLAVLQEAEAIAAEWVTDTRLSHVLDKMPADTSIESTGAVIAAMVEDVTREAAGEITMTRQAMAAIGKATAKLFKARLRGAL